MIKLQEAELTSVLPAYIKENTDVQAISYAFQMGMRKFSQYVASSALYGNIDTLPEFLLDLLSIETRCQYYEESLPIEIKREMIRNSLAWYFKSGTVSAVEELIQVVFGKGELEEWFQFGGVPGTFRVRLQLGDSDIPVDIHDIWKRIRWYKKLSAHLVGIRIGYYFGVPIRYENAITFRCAFYPRFNLPQLRLDRRWKLNGGRKLSGYDSQETMDLYPVAVRFRAGAKAAVEEVSRIHLLTRAGIPEGIHGGTSLQVRTAADCQAVTSQKIRIQTKAGESTGERTQVCVQTEAREEARTRTEITVKSMAGHEAESKEQLRVRASAACTAGVGDITIYNKNRMSGGWKLNGSRKLNGGAEIR